MKVLIVHPQMNVYGGAELVIVKLSNYMEKKGIEHALLTTKISSTIIKELRKIEIIQREEQVSRNYLDHLLGIPFNTIYALHKGIKENLDRFDVINIHNYPAEFSIIQCNKPVVWMCNEPLLYLKFEHKPKSSIISKQRLKMYLEMEKLIVKKHVKYACVSDKFNAERFRKIYGFNPKIIYYGIDYDFFSQRGYEKVLMNFDPSEHFLILQVGWIQPFKNQIESLKTLKKIKNKIPNIKLVLAGAEEEGYKDMLIRYIKENDLEKYVIFTGFLDREYIRELYHVCDVLLHPVKAQGGWLAPFEALCAGKPIVVSNEMTASYIIKREGIGIVTNDYAEAILDIYDKTDKYREIAIKGQKWVRENLNWDKFCKKMVDTFYNAMGV